MCNTPQSHGAFVATTMTKYERQQQEIFDCIAAACAYEMHMRVAAHGIVAHRKIEQPTELNDDKVGGAGGDEGVFWLDDV